MADEAHLLDAERRYVKGLADALAALDLGEQHPFALPGESERERRGHGRLADAPLAGHHVQAHAVEGAVERRCGHDIHPRWGRRHPRTPTAPGRGRVPVSAW